MKMERLTEEQRDAIEESSNGRIKFHTVNGTVNRVEINDPAVGRLSIVLESYSINICAPKRKKIYLLSWMQPVPGDKVLMEREFASEHEREDFININMNNFTRDELTLEVIEVEDC